jgi:anti-sigma regulatory factor (Ser/Thr protein kinase)
LDIAQGPWCRSVRLNAALSSAAEARRFVAEVLVGILTPADIDFVVLLTSELVTNAVVHTGSPVDLVVRGVLNGGVQIEASDAGHGMPAVQAGALDSEAGRGMDIVAALSEGWGVTPRAHGKTVWFRYLPDGHQ